MRSVLLVGITLSALLGGHAYAAPTVTFGGDGGEYSNDGECDDPRFEGGGMTATPLLSDDIMNDATDCGAAYAKGNLSLRGVAEDGTPDFGDDSGEYAKDGECDDLRFIGTGMTESNLIEDDIMHDATDCAAAFAKGKIELNL